MVRNLHPTFEILGEMNVYIQLQISIYLYVLYSHIYLLCSLSRVETIAHLDDLQQTTNRLDSSTNENNDHQ